MPDSFTTFLLKRGSDGTTFPYTIGTTPAGGPYVLDDTRADADPVNSPTKRWIYKVFETTTGGVSVPYNTTTINSVHLGQVKWAKALLGQFVGVNAVAVAADDSVYAAGSASGSIDFGSGAIGLSGTQSAFLVKYSAAGALLWYKILSGAGGGDTSGQGLAIDSGGNVVMVGSFQDTVDFTGNGTGVQDVTKLTVPLPINHPGSWGFVAKYSASGTLSWVIAMGASDGSGGQALKSVQIGPSNSISVTGLVNPASVDPESVTYFFGNLTFVPPGSSSVSVFIGRADSAGTALWAEAFGDLARGFGVAVAPDTDGTVVVCGPFQGNVDFGGGARTSVASFDIFVAAFSGTDGSWIWDNEYNGTGFSSGDRGNCLAIDQTSGNITMGGSMGGSIDFGGGTISGGHFLLRLDPSGNYQWARAYGTGSTDDGVFGVALGQFGIALCGTVYAGAIRFQGDPTPYLIGNGNDNFYIASLTGDSQIQRWDYRAGAGMNGLSSGNSVAVGTNTLVAGGQLQLTVMFEPNGTAYTAPPATKAGFIVVYYN